MGKTRVHELAKELDMSSKDLIKRLVDLGIDVKNHMSTVDNDVIRRFKDRIIGKEKVELKQPKEQQPITNHKDHQTGAKGQFPNQHQSSRQPNKQGQPQKFPKNGVQNRQAHQNAKNAPRQDQPVKQHNRFNNSHNNNNNTNGNNKNHKPKHPFNKTVSQPKVVEEENEIKTDVLEILPFEETGFYNDKHDKKNKPARGKSFDKKQEDKGKKKPFQKHNRDQRRHQYNAKQQPPRDTQVKSITIGESLTVHELGLKMGKSPGELIKKLLDMGVFASINQEIDADTATILASEYGIAVEVKIKKDITVIEEVPDDPEKLVERPPVVTIMGHVDHGKTSLLDAIRETNVTAQEAGGITQHIGAYQVEIHNKKITFLDTPGHEAFTAMRARGAKVTDIAILVVAADDGIMPQTVEAINHAQAANVPIIVAVNKIDKPNANPERVKQQLTEYNLVAEEWGGETIVVPVSAITREGIENLLEMILLVAEVQELKADPTKPAIGTVIEAELDKGRGPVATVLIQNGSLNIGDNVVVGTYYGKVRAMMDYKGRRTKTAGPSTPVEVLGLSDVPAAGDILNVVADEKLARQIAEERQSKKREEEIQKSGKISLDDLFKQIKEGQIKDLNIIIKADVQGSVEALRQSLQGLSTDEVRVNVIHGGVGAITETDIMLAAASNAIIIGFNVRPDTNARRTAENQQVDVRHYRVIYEALEDVKQAMTGLLEPEYKEVQLGRAEVRATFKVPKVGVIAGCFLLEGKLVKNCDVRVIRDGVVIHEGKIDSLKRFKDDVKEVVQGYECGIGLENFNDIKEGDIIEGYKIEAVKRESV